MLHVDWSSWLACWTVISPEFHRHVSQLHRIPTLLLSCLSFASFPPSRLSSIPSFAPYPLFSLLAFTPYFPFISLICKSAFEPHLRSVLHFLLPQLPLRLTYPYPSSIPFLIFCRFLSGPFSVFVVTYPFFLLSLRLYLPSLITYLQGSNKLSLTIVPLIRARGVSIRNCSQRNNKKQQQQQRQQQQQQQQHEEGYSTVCSLRVGK